MKKKVLIGCIIVILGFCLASFMEREVAIFIGYTTDKDSLVLYPKVELDGELIYTDSVFSCFMYIPNSEIYKKLRFGFHSITINLLDEERKQTVYFLYTLKRYIFIDFYPQERQKDNHFFWVDTSTRYPI